MQASTVWALNNHFSANVTPNNASAGLGPGRLENNAHLFGKKMEPKDFKGLWNWKKLDLEGTFAALAYSMSNEVRANRNYYGYGQEPTISVGRVAAIYAIQWPWMSLHCATLLIGAAFLCPTITRTGATRTPVFKSHSLAILANGSHLFPSVAGAERRSRAIDRWARTNRAKIGGDDDPTPPHDLDTHDDRVSHDQAERRTRSPGSDRSNTALGRGSSVSTCSSSLSNGV